MTHDERISSYIDNEFSSEQEQEFLISLAASEGLRKSFRSELVLKKVLHHDEAAMNPPRKLRGAVFATLGLSGVGLTANKANATQAASHGMLKALFATKMSTLVTIAGLTASALAGYGVRAIVNPEVTPSSQVTNVLNGTHSAAPVMQNMSQPASTPSTVVNNAATLAEKKPMALAKHHKLAPPAVTTASEPVSGAVGGGPIGMEPPKINPGH
jgi:negative regulator of sigma E activity